MTLIMRVIGVFNWETCRWGMATTLVPVAIVGLGLLHPNALFSAAVLLMPAWLVAAYRFVSEVDRRHGALLATGVVVSGLLAGAFVLRH